MYQVSWQGDNNGQSKEELQEPVNENGFEHS